VPLSVNCSTLAESAVDMLCTVSIFPLCAFSTRQGATAVVSMRMRHRWSAVLLSSNWTICAESAVDVPDTDHLDAVEVLQPQVPVVAVDELPQVVGAAVVLELLHAGRVGRGHVLRREQPARVDILQLDVSAASVDDPPPVDEENIASYQQLTADTF
jgi:hypothetical protein